MRKFKANFTIIFLFITILTCIAVPFDTVEGATSIKNNALKMAESCGNYVLEFCEEMPSKSTKSVKLTDKTCLTIAAASWDPSDGIKRCNDLFGKKVSKSVLPMEKDWETNRKNYSKLSKLVVRLEDGEIVSNIGDMGDHDLKTEVKSFKKKGNTYILKVKNYTVVYDGERLTAKHNFAETTFKFSKCKVSKYKLKIKGIKIKKVSDSVFPGIEDYK